MSFMTMLSRKFELPSPSEALPGRTEPVVLSEKHAFLGRSLTDPIPHNANLVILGMGSFWAAEPLFWGLPDVFLTTAGFSGGHTPNPTYNEVGTGRTGHAEVVRIIYDPATLTLGTILKIFWEGHNPTQGMRQGNDVGTQFRSLIHVGGETALAEAEKSRQAYQDALRQADIRSTITTTIACRDDFYFANDYHQQYALKNGGTGKSLKSLGVTFNDSV